MPATSPATAELVLHVGAPKTGSSAVQRHFCTHAEELGRLGVHYPPHPLDANGVSGGHGELTTLLLTGHAPEVGRRVRSHLADARRAGRRLFLSAESFLPHARGLSLAVPRRRTHVVCIIRHPLDALASHYNQGVKRHFGKGPLRQAVKVVLSGQLPNPTLSGTALFDWLERFGRERMTVVPYVAHGKAIDATATMLALLGLPPAPGEPAVNRSYTPAAIEFKRLVNGLPPEVLLPFDASSDASLQAYSDVRPADRPALEELLDEDEVAALERHFQPDVDRIAETFGITIDRLRPVPTAAVRPGGADSLAVVWEHVAGDPVLAAAVRDAVVAASGDAGASIEALARIIEGARPGGG